MIAGDVLTSKNVRAIRPGLGLSIKYLDIILGRKLKKNVARGTPLSWEILD
jgi:N-acetylneuraminate synthase